MTRFVTTQQASKPDTVNEAGGVAFSKSPEMELVELAFTSKLKSGYYKNENETQNRICQLVRLVDPQFAAQVACYTRHKMGMRTVSHVIAGEISKFASGPMFPFLSGFYDTVIRRPDDMTEIIAYISDGGNFDSAKAARQGRSLPKAMQRGFRKAFNRFSAYQLGAYRGEGTDCSLVDLVRLVHPRHRDEIAALVKGELRSEKQDAALTQAGQRAKETGESVETLKAEVWREKLPTLGYNALVMNCRNICTQAPDLIGALCERIGDPVAVRKSLILPLQIWAAYDVCASEGCDRRVLSALGKALDFAGRNIELPGTTLIAIDNSGSMGNYQDVARGTGSKNNSQLAGSPIRLAGLFGAILAKALGADVLTFSDSADYANYNPDDSTLTLAQQFATGQKPCGTNFECIFQTARTKYDRIVILSDMQAWIGSTQQGYKQHQPQAFLYCFDLQGYGTTQFPAHKVAQCAGLSVGALDTFKLLEANRNAMPDEIKQVRFNREWVNAINSANA